MRKKIILAIIIALIFFFAFTYIFFIRSNLICSKMSSWKSCDQNPFCEPVRNFIPVDYEGSPWNCENKL